MKKILLAILLFTSVFAFSQTDKVEKDIKELLVLTGSAQLGKQVASQMFDSFEKMYPQVPAEFWDEFKKEMKTDDLINLMVPIYKKYYTHDEIKDLIKFYKTPIGQKTISVMPSVTQDAMAAGQTWGQEIAMKVLEKMKEKGYYEE